MKNLYGESKLDTSQETGRLIAVKEQSLKNIQKTEVFQEDRVIYFVKKFKRKHFSKLLISLRYLLKQSGNSITIIIYRSYSWNTTSTESEYLRYLLEYLQNQSCEVSIVFNRYFFLSMLEQVVRQFANTPNLKFYLKNSKEETEIKDCMRDNSYLIGVV